PEEEPHQQPTAPQTECPMLDAHLQRPRCAVTPMTGNELERTAAVPETGMLQRRELIQPCCEQEDTSEEPAGARHQRREESNPFQPPLGTCCQHTEGTPHDQIPRCKDAGGDKGCTFCLLAPLDAGKEEE